MERPSTGTRIIKKLIMPKTLRLRSDVANVLWKKTTWVTVAAMTVV